MFPNNVSQELKEDFCNIRESVRLDLMEGKSLENSINKNLVGRIISNEVYEIFSECLINTDYEELNPKNDGCISCLNSYARTSENFKLAEDF